MDFVEMLLNRFDSEAEMKKPGSALVCFSKPETGKVLSRLATRIIRSRSEKSSVTLLCFIDKAKQILYSEEMDEYQNKIITDIMPAEEREKVIIRLFVKPFDDYPSEILKTAEEQKSNLILLGVGCNDFSLELAKKYSKLKSDPANSESSILEQFQEREAEILKGINMLFSKNMTTTALFIDNGITEFKRVFIPILQKADIHVFTYLYRIAQRENMKMMVWDAIGIIQSEPKMQKLYQFIVKKTEGRIHLWDNDKKIGRDFIEEQDLIITGTEGWNKLICTPLQWRDALPSMLIIKENTN